MDIQSLIRERNRLFKLYCNKNYPALKVTEQMKKRSKLSYIQNKQYERITHVTREIKSKKNNINFFFQKKTWEATKSIVTLKSNTAPNLIISNGKAVTNKFSVAEIWNIFFNKVGLNLASKILKAKEAF